MEIRFDEAHAKFSVIVFGGIFWRGRKGCRLHAWAHFFLSTGFFSRMRENLVKIYHHGPNLRAFQKTADNMRLTLNFSNSFSELNMP